MLKVRYGFSSYPSGHGPAANHLPGPYTSCKTLKSQQAIVYVFTFINMTCSFTNIYLWPACLIRRLCLHTHRHKPRLLRGGKGAGSEHLANLLCALTFTHFPFAHAHSTTQDAVFSQHKRPVFSPMSQEFCAQTSGEWRFILTKELYKNDATLVCGLLIWNHVPQMFSNTIVGFADYGGSLRIVNLLRRMNCSTIGTLTF